MSGIVDQRVGERVRPRVSRRRDVDIRARCGDGHRAVCWVGVRGHRESGAGVIGEKRPAHLRQSRGGGGIRRGGRGDVERYRGNRCASEAVDSRVGERIKSGVPSRRSVDIGAVASDRDGAVRGGGIAAHGEPDAQVVRQHRRAVQDSIGCRCSRVIRACCADRYRDRGRRRTTIRVGDGVGERVGARIVGCRCVEIRSVIVDYDCAVPWIAVGGDRECGAGIVAKYGCSRDGSVRWRCNGVIESPGCYHDVHGRSGGLRAGIGDGVGERVGSAVAVGRQVDVGAVGRHRDRAVGGSGGSGNRERGAEIVGQDRRAIQWRVRYRGHVVIGGDRGDHQ